MPWCFFSAPFFLPDCLVAIKPCSDQDLDDLAERRGQKKHNKSSSTSTRNLMRILTLALSATKIFSRKQDFKRLLNRGKQSVSGPESYRKFFIIITAAGPTRTTKMPGKMKSTSGKSICTAVF